MDTFEKLPDDHPAKLEIARLRRENDELKRDNKHLGEISYLLRCVNIGRNALARIERMNCNVLVSDICRRAEESIYAEFKEMEKYHIPQGIQSPDVETY